ncbi:MAG: tetratricopeptide repeat protein [Planctomycetaceae bacterium]|nr:tetratricopeptide repeat protein [Planctomycetaceae bacterium]
MNARAKRQSQSPLKPARWQILVAAAVIAASVLAAYANSLHGQFVYDDHVAIVNNPHIRHLWPPGEAMSLPMWNTGATVDGRPVLSFTLALNRSLFGPDPWSFHAGNLIIHLAAALVLLGIIRRTLCLPQFSANGSARAVWVALAACVLWALHPLTTAAVTYVVQRAESLMALLYLLTLYCAIRGFEARRSWPWYAASVAACALGMGTKEVMASAPVVVLLYDCVFVCGSVKKALQHRWRFYAPLAATWLILAGLLRATSGNVGEIYQRVGTWQYLATQPEVLLHYLRLAAWPDVLVLEYTWPFAHSAASIALQAAVVVTLLMLAAWGAWRRRWWGFCGAACFLVLAPSSSFYPLSQNAFEHRMYLPLAGVIVLVVGCAGWLGSKALRASKSPLAAIAALMLVLVVGAALGWRTRQRNSDYLSEQGLWERTIADRPASSVAHYHLGHVLRRQGNLERAIGQYRRSVQLDATRYDAWSNLGQALLLDAQRARLAGESERSSALLHEAAALFESVTRRRPDMTEPWVGLGKVHAAQGNLEEAVTDFQAALAIRSTDAWANTELGSARMRQGRFQEAVAHFRQVVTTNPHEAQSRFLLARALSAAGEADAAIEQYQAATSLDGDYAPAHADLGLALLLRGRTGQAIDHFRQALRIAPDDLRTVNNLAWVLATHPKAEFRSGAGAVELARRACAATDHQNATLLATLAAAYAESGMFPQAVSTCQDAIKLAATTHKEMIADYERQLTCYRQGRPYRDASLPPP